MKDFFNRMPLPVKLILIGFIPLLFAAFLTVQLYSERAEKVKLLNSFIERVHQSSNITELIDNLQLERNYSYEYALKKDGREQMTRQRPVTDSIVARLASTSHDLADFTSYTFLKELDSVRTQIDSAKYS